MKPSERERIEAHLAGCPACTATLAELREVVSRAATLADTAPTEDPWPGIEAQLTPRSRRTRVRGSRIAGGPSWWSRRLDLALPQLAAAGVLLVALSAAAMWLVLRGPAGPAGGPSGGETAPAQGPRGPGPGAGTGAEADAGQGAGAEADAGADDRSLQVAATNRRYDAAVADLERVLAEGRDRLDPRTLRVVEENLRIVDRALDDARRAVAADPGNAWLRSHLAATMRRKVDLLRSAAWLVSGESG